MPVPFDLNELSLPSDSEIPKLLKKHRDIYPVMFKDQEFLTVEGDKTHDIYLVLSGAYVVEHPHSNPKKKLAGTLAIVAHSTDEISFVGEMAYIGNTVRSASVRSTGATYALVLKPRHLDIIINSYAQLTRTLTKQFVLRLNEADQIIKDLYEKILMESQFVSRAPGETLFRSGDRAACVYQLVEGALICEETGETITADKTIGGLGFIDPQAYFSGGCYLRTVKASTGVMLVAICENSKTALVRNFPEILLALYQDKSS